LLAEAVSQARAAAGEDAVMRVLDIDPDSRVPERRMMLTPFPEEARDRKRARERRQR
jgi:protein ImuB